MLKRLVSRIREYKLPTILTFIFIIGEVIIEAFIPFVTARLINNVKAGIQMSQVVKIGSVLVLMTFFRSLVERLL